MTGTLIEQLQQPARVDMLQPIAARFVYALRLVALHQRAERDPLAELAIRMRSVTAAGEALSLVSCLARAWPENFHVSSYCCKCMTHDERTIGIAIEAAQRRDHEAFIAEFEGLLRPDRIKRLWDAMLALIAAESHASAPSADL